MNTALQKNLKALFCCCLAKMSLSSKYLKITNILTYFKFARIGIPKNIKHFLGLLFAIKWLLKAERKHFDQFISLITSCLKISILCILYQLVLITSRKLYQDWLSKTQEISPKAKLSFPSTFPPNVNFDDDRNSRENSTSNQINLIKTQKSILPDQSDSEFHRSKFPEKFHFHMILKSKIYLLLINFDGYINQINLQKCVSSFF